MKENLNESIKETIDTLIENLTTGDAVSENTSRNLEIIKEKMKEKDIFDAESIYYLLGFIIDDYKESILNYFLSIGDFDVSTQHKILTVYKDYADISSFIKSFIRKYENFGASADKSRWLIDNYLNWLYSCGENYNELDNNDDYRPGFGTAKDWIDFIDSYIDNRHTFSEKFYETSYVLINKANEKYKKANKKHDNV